MATIEKRTTEDGTPSYRVKIRLKGHPPQSATFTRLTDARKWAQSTEAAMREGRHFKTAEAKRHTVADLMTATPGTCSRKNPTRIDCNSRRNWPAGGPNSDTCCCPT